MAEDATLVFTATNRIATSDADAANLPVQVTLSAQGGVLTLARLTGLTFSAGDGVSDSSIVFTATITDTNATLDGITYTPMLGAGPQGSVTITTDDQGHSGSGGPQQDTDTVNISVAVCGVNYRTISGSPIARITVGKDGSQQVEARTLCKIGSSSSNR